jgi:predicted transcriptional regulator
MKIKSLMSSPVETIHESETLKDAASKMTKKRIGCLPVVNDEGELVGILSESDFIAKSHSIPFSRVDAPQLFGVWMSRDKVEEMYKEAADIKIKDIMTKNVITITEEETVDDLVKLLIKHNYYRYPVVKDNKPIGMVSKRDFLKLIFMPEKE